jgi:hypothetical protein
MRRLLLKIMATTLLAAPAMAQQAGPALPAWNIRGHCEQQMRVLASESAFLLRSCLDQEERSEAMVRRGWDTLAPAIRRTCLAQQQALRMSSYFLLNACVEQEAGATRDLERRPPR